MLIVGAAKFRDCSSGFAFLFSVLCDQGHSYSIIALT